MSGVSRAPLRIAVAMDRGEEVQMSLWFHTQRHLRQSGSCVFSLFSPEANGLQRLARWRPDGVLGYVQDPVVLERLQGLGKPLVNTSGALGTDVCRTVCPDNEAIGRLAAEHLLTKSCRHFGFVGVPGHRYSELQWAGFETVLEREGKQSATFGGRVHPLPTVPPAQTAIRRNRPLLRWLKSLPSDTGLLISDSWLGMRICDLAAAVGIDLLADFAIVTGHDCDVPSVPSLSGVHISEQQWSCQAAQLLLDVLANRPVPPGPVLIQPTGVNERGSTARTRVADKHLCDALRFIQNQAEVVITVDEVARVASLSRRALERRFREQLGRTILDEIHRVHLEQAKRLLVETDMTMQAVARRSGLTDDRQLLRLFHQREGTSPGAYRRQFRTT